MNFAAYTGQSGQLIGPFQNALIAFSNDSLLGGFLDSWTPARTMLNTGTTTAAQLAVLYNADPTPLIASYTTGVTGGLDSIKKALAAIPGFTASDYLTMASSLLSGYVIGPAILGNTLKYHKMSHHTIFMVVVD
jgi:hypothetical protein